MKSIRDKVKDVLYNSIGCESRQKIVQEIENDGVLVQLDLIDPVVSMFGWNSQMVVCIGPRKFVFDVDGNWQGSQTHFA